MVDICLEEVGEIELPSLKQTAAWEKPIFFDELDTPAICAQWLPGVLREFAAAMAEATETPEALSVMTVLGVISAILAKQIVVSPIAGWQEPVNLYTLIALPPANHKSLVLNHCIKPLLDWEKKQRLQMAADIHRQSSERKTQEKIVEGLRARIAKLKNPIEQQRLIADITEREANLPHVPVAPILFTNDATPESLSTLVHEQHGRLAIFSDEGGILETLSGLYSNGFANIDILLKGIDGGDVRIQRKNRSLTLNPYLTIVLTAQPGVIQHMGQKQVYLGNGALERFLYVVPKSNLGYRTHNKPPVSEAIQTAYYQTIMQLLDQFSEQNPRFSQARVLTLSPAAYKAWRDFQARVEIELRPSGKLIHCQGWGGKISGFALRIAGLLHTMEYGLDNTSISNTTMQNALNIATALIEHAIAAFGMMSIDNATEDAKIIVDWVKASHKKLFKQSELVLAMRNKKSGKSERLAKALQVLYERNIISAPVKLPTRKPTTVYYVNPGIF
jgi:hypothetical protein